MVVQKVYVTPVDKVMVATWTTEILIGDITDFFSLATSLSLVFHLSGVFLERRAELTHKCDLRTDGFFSLYKEDFYYKVLLR